MNKLSFLISSQSSQRTRKLHLWTRSRACTEQAHSRLNQLRSQKCVADADIMSTAFRLCIQTLGTICVMIPDPILSISVKIDASFKITIPLSFALSFSFNAKTLGSFTYVWGPTTLGTNLFLRNTRVSAKNPEWPCVL